MSPIVDVPLVDATTQDLHAVVMDRLRFYRSRTTFTVVKKEAMDRCNENAKIGVLRDFIKSF